MNLDKFFEESSQYRLTNSSILHLGLEIIELLEGIHLAGYTYNDLKLDNLLIGYKDRPQIQKNLSGNCFEDCEIHLVDFGFAKQYIDKKTKAHIEQNDVDSFRGNMIFASLNQLNFLETSRRDDLLSLCYMLIYLLNRGHLKGIDLSANLSKNQSFRQAK